MSIYLFKCFSMIDQVFLYDDKPFYVYNTLWNKIFLAVTKECVFNIYMDGTHPLNDNRPIDINIHQESMAMWSKMSPYLAQHGPSQGLETGCPKLAIVKFCGILYLIEDNIFIL